MLNAIRSRHVNYNIFWGEESRHEHTPHEAPKSMTMPLVFLAAVTVVAGFIPFGHFVSSDGTAYTIHLNWAVAGASVVVAVVAIAIATALYRKKSPVPDRMAAAMPGHLQLRLPAHRLVRPPRHRRLLQRPGLPVATGFLRRAGHPVRPGSAVRLRDSVGNSRHRGLSVMVIVRI